MRIDRHEHRWCLAAVIAGYVMLFGTLLAVTDGVPYVFDNNETFSSLWHAYNMYHFDPAASSLLTDEAGSPHAAAHPFVYTHQGNFPRLFAFLIFVLGARDVAAQIVVHTFTIGLASILLSYHFFAKTVRPLFALVACLFLMTDYVMLAQWQVNTYRVWHGFFIFSTLVCVCNVNSERPWRWRAATFLNFACIFYWEFVFAAMMAILATAYAAYLNGFRFRRLVLAMAPGVLGACLAAGVLFAQLVAYMGFDAVLFDIQTTISARNAANVDWESARGFYEGHNIVFWQNYFDGSIFRNPGLFVRGFLTFCMVAYTPALTLITGLIAVAALVNGLVAPIERRFLRAAAGGGRTWKFACLLVASVHTLRYVLRDKRFAGYSGSSEPSTIESLTIWSASIALGVLGTILLERIVSRRGAGFGSLSAGRILLAAGAVVVAGRFVRHQPLWYWQDYSPIWTTLGNVWDQSILQRVAVLAAMTVATVILLGRFPMAARDRRGLARLPAFFVTGAIAYTAVYFLQTGYVYTGYLTRWCPLISHVSNPLLAVGTYVLGSGLVHSIRVRIRWYRRRRPSSALPWSRRLDIAAVPSALAGLVIFVVGYWCTLQALYIEYLPPDHYAFLERLREPPYRGQSFTLNGYALPITWSTHHWAYYDERIMYGKIVSDERGYRIDRDTNTYLWYADRFSNPEYQTPRYCLLIALQDMQLAAYRLRGIPDPRNPLQQSLLRASRNDIERRLLPKLREVDDSRFTRWAILEFDWSKGGLVEFDGNRDDPTSESGRSTQTADVLNERTQNR